MAKPDQPQTHCIGVDFTSASRKDGKERLRFWGIMEKGRPTDVFQNNSTETMLDSVPIDEGWDAVVKKIKHHARTRRLPVEPGAYDPPPGLKAA